LGNYFVFPQIVQFGGPDLLEIGFGGGPVFLHGIDTGHDFVGRLDVVVEFFSIVLSVYAAEVQNPVIDFVNVFDAEIDGAVRVKHEAEAVVVEVRTEVVALEVL